MPPSPFDVLRWTLLGALGASLASCGGTTDDDGGDGGSTSGGGAPGGDGGSAGSGSTTGTGSATGSGGFGPGVSNCTNPTELDGGFVSCDEGYSHRPEAGTCPDGTPRSEPVADPEMVPDATCYSDADCEGSLEYCLPYQEGSIVGTYCASGCLSDADCGAGFICRCGSPLGACVAATCASNADCQDGLLCTPWSADDGCGPSVTYACQSTGDSCRSVGDCDTGEECRPSDSGSRSCQPREYLCAVGRPFFVGGEPRLAKAVRRGDWLASVAPSSQVDFDWAAIAEAARALPDEVRARVGTHHARAGRMEHASIAAFARFALELLALGAPAELVELTNSAQVDETRHARICFRLAEIYGGVPVGPGPLDVSGPVVGARLRDIVRTAIVEGCIGETVAALEAREAARLATDPALAAVLASIAEDEERHAELAYRFVRWAVEREPAAVALLAPELERALAESVRVNGGGSEAVIEANGVLADATASRVRMRALREVVAPAFAMLRSLAAVDGEKTPRESRSLP